MIIYNNDFQKTLLALHIKLRELRYDWIYRSIKGLPYFVDSSIGDIPIAVNEYLSEVSLLHNIAFRLFRLGQSVSFSEAESLLSTSLLGELIKLGLIVVEGESFHLGGYTIVSWLGFYIISTDPITKPFTNLTSEQYRLATELMKTSGNTALDINSGCGLASLVAATKFNKVIVYSSNAEALNVTLVNAALNNLAGKVIGLESLPNTLEDLSDIDLVFASQTTLPLPKTIEKLLTNKEIDILEIFSKLIDQYPINGKIIIQCLGNEELRSVTNQIEGFLVKNNHKVKMFVLSRNYISFSYLDALAQAINYQSSNTNITAQEIFNELVNFYEERAAQCVYLILLEINFNESPAFEIINFASELTSQDDLEILEDIRLSEKELIVLKIKDKNIEIQLDQIEKDIIEMLDEDKIMLKEMAEKISSTYNISYETAGTKILEFCHSLFLQGLLSNIAMSGLRGQMRLMALNAVKFGNTLKTLGEELDKGGV